MWIQLASGKIYKAVSGVWCSPSSWSGASPLSLHFLGFAVCGVQKMLKTQWCGRWRPKREEVRDGMTEQNYVRLIFVESLLEKENSLYNFLFYSSVWVLISVRGCPHTPGKALSSKLLLCLGWGVGPTCSSHSLQKLVEEKEYENLTIKLLVQVLWSDPWTYLKKAASPHSKKNPMFWEPAPWHLQLLEILSFLFPWK